MREFAKHPLKPATDTAHTRSRLNSWKEIAQFLNCGVRTVQRWEVELRLPIHRIGAGKRAPVYAIVSEVKFWLSTSGRVREALSANNQTAPTARDRERHDSLVRRLQSLAQTVANNTTRHQLQADVLEKRIAAVRSQVRARKAPVAFGNQTGLLHRQFSADARAENILCVDDSASGLRMRKLLLESHGYSVKTASSAEQALQLFHSESFDAVVVDYAMPGMDGKALSVELKRLRPRIPVVMLSAYDPFGLQLGTSVDAFVRKGDQPERLLTKLAWLIRLRGHSHPELQGSHVVFVDESRQYVDCSDGVCELLGYSRAELVELKIDDISYKPQVVAPLFGKYVKNSRLNGQYTLRHKNGNPIWIRYQSKVFADGCMAAVWQPLARHQ